MTQPKFAPIPLEDEVRPGYRLEPPKPWVADRPGDWRAGAVPNGPGTGVPGPDQGYALLLARRFEDRLVLSDGEHADDALVGAVVVGLRRAALYGRAPVITDIELALGAFGFLDEAPAELVEHRRKVFAGASHHYWEQRELAHALPESTLRMKPDAVRADLGGWRELLGLG